MFKLRQSADLTRNNIISCYKLKIMHWLILSISACILFSTIVNIRAPTFVQILFIFLGGFIIYKIHLKIKIFRYDLEHYLIIRESLLYVLHTNRLYTTYKDSTGQEKVIRSAILEYELDRQKGHVLIKALIRGDEFSHKLKSLENELCGVLELELEKKVLRPSVAEYHFYYIKPKRLVLQSHNQRQEIDSLDIDLGYGVNYNPIKCPHILASGGTGRGKSVFISFLIA